MVFIETVFQFNGPEILHHIDIVNDLIIHKTLAQSAECAL